MSDDKKNKANKEKQFSRRDFLKTTGVATGGIIGGSLLGGIVGLNIDEGSELQTETASEGDTSNPYGQHGEDNFTEARMFISRDSDFDALTAAAERIYPEDENGPGATGLGVPYFIDRQLAGQWGINAKEYMDGPFLEDPDPAFGYQSSMTRAEIFIEGLRRLNEISQDEIEDDFQNIDETAQDAILVQFEENDVEMEGIDSGVFFSLLRDATLEGVYSDPLYGGNRNLEGWRMKEYPGAYPAYIDVIEQDEFFETDPVSLSNHH